VVWLRAALNDPEARGLAADLLAGGSADVVVLGYGNPPGLDPPDPRAQLAWQAIRIRHSDWKSLRDALSFAGTRTAAEVWPELQLANGDRFYVRGTRVCRPAEQVDDAGMVMVSLCSGTFTMGTAENDPGAELAWSAERPAHSVTLSDFHIGKYEVTHEQYWAFEPDHESSWSQRLGRESSAELPVTDVDWSQAMAFCESRGYRLPTEAEWEYAARAGTRDPWSFPVPEKDLRLYAESAKSNRFSARIPIGAEAMKSQFDRFAWHSGNASEAQPVGTRDANPWGLHDMHGSVWEWVNDWHGSYLPGLQVDPVGPATGDYRALRGGSFFLRARGPALRGPGRGGGGPVNRGRFVGFRCARGPAPPP